jgi:hypothetical protein
LIRIARAAGALPVPLSVISCFYLDEYFNKTTFFVMNKYCNPTLYIRMFRYETVILEYIVEMEERSPTKTNAGPRGAAGG